MINWFQLKESIGANGRGKTWTWFKNEENGSRDGTSIWNESEREEAKIEGYWTRANSPAWGTEKGTLNCLHWKLVKTTFILILNLFKALEVQIRELEDRKKAFENEKSEWEQSNGITLDDLRRKSLEANSKE